MAEAGISLQDLVDKFQLLQDQLDRELTEEHLRETAMIIADHEIVGRELGLSVPEMTAIVSHVNNRELQNIEMLRKWKQKLAWKATYRKLIEALLRCSRGDHARDVCELLTQGVSVASAVASAPSHQTHHDTTTTGGAEHECQAKKRSRCGKCEACLAKPCGNCTPCRKKTEGLPYTRPCIVRKCPNMTYKMKRKATNQAQEPNVKKAKVIRDNSKGSNSALLFSASSSQGLIGVLTPPSDLRMVKQEDGWKDSTETSEMTENKVTEVVTTLHGKIATMLKKAEEETKGFQVTVKEKEAGLKSAEQKLKIFQVSLKEKETELKKAEENLKTLRATLKTKEMELNKAEQKTKALQATLQEREQKWKAFQAVKEAELKKSGVKSTALQATLKERETELKKAGEKSKTLQAMLKQKESELKFLVAKLEQSKNEMKAKLASFIQQL